MSNKVFALIDEIWGIDPDAAAYITDNGLEGFVRLGIIRSGVRHIKEFDRRRTYWAKIFVELLERMGSRASYLTRQDAMGLKAGDLVRVTCTAKTRQDGWVNSWPSSMDEYVGETLRVLDTYMDEGGVQLTPCFKFPYFVLEKVEEQK